MIKSAVCTDLHHSKWPGNQFLLRKPNAMRPYSHINITLVGFGNVGRCILNVLLQDHHRRYRVNILDPSNKVSGSMRDLGHASMLTKRHEIVWNCTDQFNEADFIFYSAGKAIPINETRNFSMADNIATVHEVFQNFTPINNPTIIVISNPVDVVSLEIMKASGVDKDNVIGVGTVIGNAKIDPSIEPRYRN